ncbi:MAG: nucleotide exchange factor GrpE [Verrucomicrobiia bacterium]
MSNETDKEVQAAPAGTQADKAAPGAVPTEELVATEWTHEQIGRWKEQAEKAQEHWDRLLRVSADFDNFKKRSARERQEAIRFANEGLIEKIIPVLDNMEMALAAAAQPEVGDSDGLKTGVEMIYNQLKTILADAGLEQIHAAGQPFDPAWHEAVSQQESADVPEGTVLHQIRKGYKLRERLIRPASVVVAKTPGA